MSKTAEEVLSDVTGFHLDKILAKGFTPYITKTDTVSAMHTYAKAVADELAKRILESPQYENYELDNFTVDSIVEQLKKEITP